MRNSREATRQELSRQEKVRKLTGHQILTGLSAIVRAFIFIPSIKENHCRILSRGVTMIRLRILKDRPSCNVKNCREARKEAEQPVKRLLQLSR